MNFLIFTLFFILSNVVDSYKILIFVPGLSNSNLLFFYRFGDMLGKRGHDVTLFVIQYNKFANIDKPKFANELKYPGIC